MTDHTHEPPDDTTDNKKKPKDVSITVNDQAVTLPDKHATGLSIKQGAIEAGVPIQLDFVLSEVQPNGHQKIIPDEHPVSVKDGDHFWAIPGDDNS